MDRSIGTTLVQVLQKYEAVARVLVFDWSDRGASCDLFTGGADTRDTVVIMQVNNGSEQYQPDPYDVLHYVP
jgi:hypothetical protein